MSRGSDRRRRDRALRQARKARLQYQLDEGKISPEEYQLRLEQIKKQTDTLRKALQPLKNSFQQFFSAIADGSRSIGDAFGNMVNSILNRLNQLATQAASNAIFGLLMDAIGGSVFGDGSSPAGKSPFDVIMGGSGSLKFGQAGTIPGFAKGGIVKEPTLGMIGEGKKNEAIIPMNKGAVPVDLKGKTGDNITVINNFDRPQVRSEEDQAKLAKQIDARIQQTLVDQQRNGEILRN